MNKKIKLNVALTVDFDAVSGFMGLGLTDPYIMSIGKLGADEGICRIVKTLKNNNVSCTFFIPSHTAENYTDKCKMIIDAGFEIGHHGYAHEITKGKTIKEERSYIEKGLIALDKYLNVRPVGYRSPCLSQTQTTYKLLSEYGFKYDSSESAKDKPYFLELGGNPRLVEIPIKLLNCDTTYYHSFSPGNYSNLPTSPSVCEEIWKKEFEGLYESDEENLCYVHTVHPFCTGSYFYRMKVYDSFISSMKSHADVNFVTMQELCDIFLTNANVIT
ncbi:MAG TPA: polysaccharide deacetylase family protein [Victivallales bacterium]|nr:polysaccharide deacetylase family protein [Victivallales bacterium]